MVPEPELVIHGGGNTSKTIIEDMYGEQIKVLCVKGRDGFRNYWPEGHPAVELAPLLKLKELSSLTDEDMVAIQKEKSFRPAHSPNPSVETLLHAFLPYKFIDHTHSLALLSLANQPNAEELLENFW